MDFGKLDRVDDVDFGLQPDHVFNQIALQNKAQQSIQCFVGPPIWANKQWLGKIYPSNAKDSDFLYHYSRQFNTIELNVTHYQIPTSETVNRWKNAVPDGFKFCPKFPQEISHDRQLIGCENLTNAFCEQISKLGDKLGCTFLQLNQGFDTKRFKVLEQYLHKLPVKWPVSVEFRHPSWFEDASAWHDALQLLKALNFGTVVSDVAGRRDVVHMALSNQRLMLRFVGNELHPTDFLRGTEWVERIKNWVAAGLSEIYIFVHCGENDFAPELTKYWIEQLNTKINLSLQQPNIRPVAVQTSLF